MKLTPVATSSSSSPTETIFTENAPVNTISFRLPASAFQQAIPASIGTGFEVETSLSFQEGISHIDTFKGTSSLSWPRKGSRSHMVFNDICMGSSRFICDEKRHLIRTMVTRKRVLGSIYGYCTWLSIRLYIRLVADIQPSCLCKASMVHLFETWRSYMSIPHFSVNVGKSQALSFQARLLHRFPQL